MISPYAYTISEEAIANIDIIAMGIAFALSTKKLNLYLP